MSRNIKALGLALAAVLALGVMTASSASAQKGTSSATPVTVKGIQNPPANSTEFTFTGNKITCVNAIATGHKVATTPHAAIPTPATEITLTPHYGTCVMATPFGNFPMTVDMNGCDYRGKLGTTTGGVAHTYGLEAFITCPPNKDIVITVGTGTNPHSTVWCEITTEHQGDGFAYTGLHATDLTNGKVRIHGMMSGFITVSTNTQATHPNFLPCSGTDSPASGNGPVIHIDVTAESVPAGTSFSLSHP